MPTQITAESRMPTVTSERDRMKERAGHLHLVGLLATTRGETERARRSLQKAAYAFTLVGEHSLAAQTYLELADLEDRVPDHAASHEAAFAAAVEAGLAGDNLRIDLAIKRMGGPARLRPLAAAA